MATGNVNFIRVLRLAAYRLFTWWIHARLGQRVRRVIPSCAVQVIRDNYPEESGVYIGYREAEEGSTEGIESQLPD